MSEQHYFHFTIGPVQGFVAQARRTRDFWAGSFLLSWLSGVAMLAVEKQLTVAKQEGEIEFPKPPEDYLHWLCGKGKGEPPRQGAIPNRFKARVAANFDAELVEKTVRDAWWALAERVWQQDLADVAGETTRLIWERQHRSFWEISWIMTTSEAADALDRRKNWRSHLHQDEPGAKCMVMEGWQELSGAPSPGHATQRLFWDSVRQQSDSLQTDLRDQEQLCALAFVKRRFARHFARFEEQVSGLSLSGWKLDSSVPSVSYMAAVHWLEAVLRHPDGLSVRRVLEAAKSLDKANDEWNTRLPCLEESKKIHDIPRSLLARDGRIFFEHERHNAKLYPDQNAVRSLDNALKALKLEAPLSPFYAILLMDGDSLGVHMGDKAKQPKIAAALNQFTTNVPGIVKSCNGFLVYAGGDDVLAVLPLEDALSCAKDLRDEYLRVFEDTGIPSTLSGAIEFAHVKMPLGRVLSDAHQLLDEVAKDERGRNALAVRVWKPGGQALEWSQPWHIALDENCQHVVLDQIAHTFEAQDAATPFSNNFFFKIRDQFELLNPTDEYPQAVLNKEHSAALLAAEYLSSGVNEKREDPITLGEAIALLQPLLRQCRPQIRSTDEHGNNPTYAVKEPNRVEEDGALLVRFLAHKGVERGGER